MIHIHLRAKMNYRNKRSFCPLELIFQFIKCPFYTKVIKHTTPLSQHRKQFKFKFKFTSKATFFHQKVLRLRLDISLFSFRKYGIGILTAQERRILLKFCFRWCFGLSLVFSFPDIMCSVVVFEIIPR